MFYFSEHLKNSRRKRDLALSEYTNEISPEQNHNEGCKNTEHAREKLIYLNRMSESTKESSKKSKTQYPRSMKQYNILPVTDGVLRYLR